jgi:predicted ribosomally synthesized peptide with SipW-like signal peptide
MLVIGVVAALIAAATTATFTDLVTSSGNSFQAGTLLMSVSDQAEGANPECGNRTFGGDLSDPGTGYTSGGVDLDNHEGCPITDMALTATDLYPGAPAVSKDFTVKNEGSIAGDLTVSVENASVEDASGGTQCGVGNFTILPASPVVQNSLAGGASATPVTVSVAMNDNAPNVCQNATLTFDVVFHLVQAASLP